MLRTTQKSTNRISQEELFYGIKNIELKNSVTKGNNTRNILSKKASLDKMASSNCLPSHKSSRAQLHQSDSNEDMNINELNSILENSHNISLQKSNMNLFDHIAGGGNEE